MVLAVENETYQHPKEWGSYWDAFIGVKVVNLHFIAGLFIARTNI
jgi:hypothetical protein